MSHNREKFIHSAGEYAEYLAQQQKLHPISVTTVKPSTIIQRRPDVTRPRTASRNASWSTEWPSKGFDETQIRSYTVRRSDRLQASLFDRFVFGKGNCHEFGAESSSKGVAQRIIHSTKPFDSNSLKQRYQSYVDGGASVDPMKMETNRWRHARYRES